MYKYLKKEKGPALLHSCVICFSLPVVPGPVLSLSTQYIRDLKQVKVLALCPGHESKSHDGNLLILLTLPVRNLTGKALMEQMRSLRHTQIDI